MTKRNIPIVKEYTNKHKKRSTRQRILIAVAALVVFCTTYAMILPAITMENKFKCNKEEHIHQSSCYGTQKVITCQQEIGKIHSHNENCYTANGELTCHIDTTVEHTHTEECYTSKMVMVCQQIMHQHTDECTTAVPNEGSTSVPTEKATQVATELTSEAVEISKDSNQADVKSETALLDSDATDLKNFLAGLGEGYGVYHEVTDNRGNPIPDISLVSGENYRLILHIDAPKGMFSGKYQYVLPVEINLMASYVDGDILHNKENVNVGDYYAKRDAQVVITVTFDKNVENYQDFYGDITFDISIDNNGEKPLPADVKKTGSFNQYTGMFEFSIEATIPSYGGKGRFKEWYIYDESKVYTSRWVQDLDGAEVTLSYNQIDENGETHLTTVSVPNIVDATESDNIAYLCSDKPTGDDSLFLLNRCKCNSSVCANGTCETLQQKFDDDNYASYTGWCTCWHSLKNSTLTIKYQNNKELKNNYDLLSRYPGRSYNNSVTLAELSDALDATFIEADVSVPIPKMIGKTGDGFDSASDYISKYTIKINEKRFDMRKVSIPQLDPTKIDISKVDLAMIGAVDDNIPDGLFIQDKMKNASFIPGSIKIEARDINTPDDVAGIELKRGVDYEIQYVPGSEDENDVYEGTLNIIILDTSACFGEYMYTINYRVQAIEEPQQGNQQARSDNGTTSVSNSATASIYSYPVATASSDCSFDESWSFRKFKLTVEKIDKVNENIKLPNAVFGLYIDDGTEDGYEIARGTTDENGLLDFATNVRKGIYFDTEQLYFVKELAAPKGYSLDSNQYWFYFSDEEVEEFKSLGTDMNIMFCELDDNTGGCEKIMQRPNEKGLTLPETGGCGTFIYLLAGSVMVVISAYALYKKFFNWEGVRK